MAIDLDALILELQSYVPQGIELPRNITNNQLLTATLERWAADAAQAINNRRGKTTIKEFALTVVADQSDYDLPDDCRTVARIERGSGCCGGVSLRDVDRVSFGCAGIGMLPNGQSITPALDLASRQAMSRSKQEDEWEVIGGRLRLGFVGDTGEEIKVRYIALDRDVEELPEDKYELVLTFMRWKSLDWHIGRHGASIAVDGDRLLNDGLAAFIRQAAELNAQWHSGLNAIGPEGTV